VQYVVPVEMMSARKRKKLCVLGCCMYETGSASVTTRAYPLSYFHPNKVPAAEASWLAPADALYLEQMHRISNRCIVARTDAMRGGSTKFFGCFAVHQSVVRTFHQRPPSIKGVERGADSMRACTSRARANERSAQTLFLRQG